METVTLKSQVGPVCLTSRPDPYTKEVYDFNFDNDFMVTVPKSWWETVEAGESLDRRDGTRLAYRNAFRVISNQRRSHG
jgi:hypothetical protein